MNKDRAYLETHNEEEYDWEAKENRLAPLSYDDAMDEADYMTDAGVKRLGFSSKDDLWIAINNEYTITE